MPILELSLLILLILGPRLSKTQQIRTESGKNQQNLSILH